MRIFTRPHLLMVLQIMLSVRCRVFSLFSGDGINPNPNPDSSPQDPSSGGGEQTCPSEKPLVFTIIPSPPYSANISGKLNDYDNLGLLSTVFQLCECLRGHSNVSIKTVGSKDELEVLVKKNRTDFGYPLFLSTGEEKVYERVYEPFSSHPGFDLFALPQSQDPGEVVLKTLLSSWPLLALSVILTGMAGIVMWLLEVFYNREEFPMSFTKGSWEGFWWAFVSMTTVGYGDKCPRSIAGRCFAVLWIFAGLIMVSVFMANVTTALTSTTYGNHNSRLDELTVGVLKDSIEESYAIRKGAQIEDFTSFEDLIDALEHNDVNGILVDRYVIGYHLKSFQDSAVVTKLKRTKHFPTAHLYTFGVVESSQYAQQIWKACKNSYQDLNFYLNSTIIENAKPFVDTGLQKVSKPSSADKKKSFNLFVDSKQDFQKVAYISFGVLAALISFGIMMDMAAAKKKKQLNITQEHEPKVGDQQQFLQEIKKGREMINQLQSFLENIEEKVKSQQLLLPRYSAKDETL